MINEYEQALIAAKKRGLEFMNEFYYLSDENKIDNIAQLLYGAIELDPYGYPNGRATWDELPEIDENHKFGTDKLRYREAARKMIKIIKWEP